MNSLIHGVCADATVAGSLEYLDSAGSLCGIRPLWMSVHVTQGAPNTGIPEERTSLT